jgi:chitodextrinase
MHDCGVATGDRWLRGVIPTILDSPAWASRGAILVITWDEDDQASGNQVPAIVIGPNVSPQTTSATAYDHYSLLATLEATWSLAPLTAQDAAATPMSDLFRLSPAADQVSPGAPGGLQGAASSDTAVSLSWQPATDNVGITAYDVYRDGSWVGESATTGFTDTTVVGLTTYSYRVTARDADANRSGYSQAISVTTPSPASTSLLTDGFESGALAGWTNSGVVVQTAEHYAGSYAARATSDGTAPADANRLLPSTYDQVYARVRIKIVSQASSSSVYLVKLRTAGGTTIAGVYRDGGGHIVLRNSGQATSTQSATLISVGAWHTIELRLRIGTSGQTEVWYDGQRLADVSLTGNFGTTQIGKLEIGDNNTGRIFDVVTDDVAVDLAYIAD